VSQVTRLAVEKAVVVTRSVAIGQLARGYRAFEQHVSLADFDLGAALETDRAAGSAIPGG